MVTETAAPAPDASPMNIATISAGFEKGDFLVREEQGNRVYFDFFEEVRCYDFCVLGRSGVAAPHVDWVLTGFRSVCRPLTTSLTRDTPVCPEKMRNIGLT